MRLVISNLLAIVLLFQALTGVCCYHVCNCGQDALESKPAVESSHCCHSHCHDGQESDHQQAPSNHQHCLGFCTYVAPPKVQVDCPLLPSLSASSELCAVLTQMAGSCTGHYELIAYPVAEPPLRLHLLHQIILI